MSKENKIIKKPHSSENMSAEQLAELIKCADPDTGYKYFMKNHFYIQHPTQGKLLYNPYGYQERLIEVYHNYRKSVSLMSRQTGKAFFIDTPILTNNGFVKLEDLKVGDVIYGKNGKETNVVFVTDTMYKHDCYKVQFDNGDCVIADAEHLWMVDNNRLLTTLEIINILDDKPYIELQSVIQNDTKKTTGDPYLCGYIANDSSIVDLIDWINSDISQRLALLQGLMDRSGSLCKNGIYCSFITTDEKIANQFRIILSTLGIKSEKILSKDKIKYTVNFMSCYQVFRNPKLDREHKRCVNDDAKRLYITNIIQVESVPVKCIKVDNEDHLFLIGHTLIPTHNTTSAAGYLLWYGMFNSDSTVLIAAHKYAGAQEIMQRIRFAYENCPDHIRAGVVTYNKGSIDFDNGSRIVSQATTENTGRGMSISLLYCLDGETTFVTIRNKTTLLEEKISLKKLYIRLYGEDKVQAVLSIFIKGLQYYANNNEYEILTPSGWKDFKGVIFNENVNKPSVLIKFIDGTNISATCEHRFYVNGIETKAEDLKVGDVLDGKNGSLIISQIESIILEDTYEIFDADGHVIFANEINSHQCDEMAFSRPSLAKEFWTAIAPTLSTGGKCIITSTPNSDEDQFALIWKGANKTIDEYGNPTDVGINGFKAFTCSWREHPDRGDEWEREQRAQIGDEKFEREMNCQFIINDETLISSMFLANMKGIDPIEKLGQVRWYKKPSPHHVYIVALDPSLGTGSDPAAIQILELPGLQQVGEWQHNKTSIQNQVRILKDIATYIIDCTGNKNDVYYSVENNTLGEAALVAISDIGEENIPGIFLSEPKTNGSRVYRKGFTTTNKSKPMVCSKLKHLVETSKIIINSKNLISELKNFVSNGTSFAAKPGETDDLVMSLLLGIRMVMVLQNYDSRIDSEIRGVEEYEMPLPFIMVTG